MGRILVVTGPLAHAVELIARRIPAREQLFALARVCFHTLDGLCQQQARLRYGLLLLAELPAGVGDIRSKALTARADLFQPGLLRRQCSAQLRVLPRQLLLLALAILALGFQTLLLLAQAIQRAFKFRDLLRRGFDFQQQSLELLLALDHAAFLLARARHS